MPHDLVDARPLVRAQRDFLRKSPRLLRRAPSTPLARVAQSWRVQFDDDARDALDRAPWSRWITRDPDDPSLGDLSPDTPVDARGLVDRDAQGDGRPLAARLVDGDRRVARCDAALRAMPLEHPEALTTSGRVGRDIAVRGGALRVARAAGEVRAVSERRVWVREEGRDAPRCYALVPRSAPRIATPFSLRAVVRPGQRVEAGDAIAANAYARGDALAVGRRATARRSTSLAPGTCRVSSALRERLGAVRLDTLDVETRDTRMGVEHCEPTAPGVDARAWRHLDASGFAPLGAELDAGDVLAGVVAPIAWERGDDGAPREVVEAKPVRVSAPCTVVGLEMFARHGRERSARHAALVEALRADVDDERRALLAAADGDEDRVARRDLWLEEERSRLGHGSDLAPGVVTLSRYDVLVRVPLAVGDTLATLEGAAWTVVDVFDDDRVCVEVPEGDVAGEVYLLRLAPEAPPAEPKRAPKRRAEKPAAR